MFLASTLLCASLVFTLATYAKPMQDDFCRAVLIPEPTWFTIPPRLQKPGIMEMTALNYLNWSGRWAGLGLEISLLSTTRQPRAYPYLVIGLLAAQLVLLYLAIRFATQQWRLALYVSGLLALVYWANMPSPQAGLFWIPGAIESQLPLSLLMLFFGLTLFRYAEGSKSTVAAVVSIILAFVIPAFHELAGSVLVLAVTLLTASSWIAGSHFRRQWLVLWACALGGFLIVFIAPGNHARMSVISNRGNPSTVVRATWGVLRHQVIPWCLGLKHWLLAALIFLDSRVQGMRRKLPGWSSFRKIASFALVWLALIVFAIAATTWSIGKLPPLRSMNLFYGMFVIGWIALAFLTVRPEGEVPWRRPYNVAVVCGALLFFSALAVRSQNTVTAVSDVVRGSAMAWDTELDRRFAMLQSADKGADVVVPKLSARPGSLVWIDITSNPTFWSNRCLAQYYGVHSVRIPASRD